MADKPRIGWIGTGVMGHSMAGHLIEAGYSLTVFNRTPSKCQSLVEKGAAPAGSPREVGEKSDVVFTMVGYPADVESVTIGPNGCLDGMKAGSILCDMTTSSPTLAGKIANRAAVSGVISLDAPVTGGDVGAMNATLSIFVGGSDEGYARILPLLQIMGQKILHCGRPGMGQQAKLANQIAIASVMFSVCESLIYAQQAGLDVRKCASSVQADGFLQVAAGEALGQAVRQKLQQVARRMQHNLPQHRRGDQLQPLRALFVRRPPAVEQAVFLTLQQRDGHRESGGPQQVQHAVQLPEDAVGRRLFGGAVSGDRLAGLWVCFSRKLFRYRLVIYFLSWDLRCFELDHAHSLFFYFLLPCSLSCLNFFCIRNNLIQFLFQRADIFTRCHDCFLVQLQRAGENRCIQIISNPDTIHARLQNPGCTFLLIGSQLIQREGDGHRLGFLRSQQLCLSKACQTPELLHQFSLWAGSVFK